MFQNMRTYFICWIYFNLFVVNAQYSDHTISLQIELKPLKRIILLFDGVFNSHLENPNYDTVFGAEFTSNRVGTNSWNLNTGNWCGGVIHNFESGTWKKENNIASIYYEDQTFYFKLNNFTGSHTVNCAGLPPSAITQYRIFHNNGNIIKSAMSCTRNLPVNSN